MGLGVIRFVIFFFFVKVVRLIVDFVDCIIIFGGVKIDFGDDMDVFCGLGGEVLLSMEGNGKNCSIFLFRGVLVMICKCFFVLVIRSSVYLSFIEGVDVIERKYILVWRLGDVVVICFS